MPVPDGEVEIKGRIVLEDRGIVDEQPERAKRVACSRNHRLGGGHIGQIGGDDRRAAAFRPDFRGEFIGLVTRAVAMDRHGKTVRGKVFHDRPADAPRPARHQRRPWGFRHFSFLRGDPRSRGVRRRTCRLGATLWPLAGLGPGIRPARTRLPFRI